jgi:hypothetical protein
MFTVYFHGSCNIFMTITSQPKASLSMWAYCIRSWFLWVNYAICSEQYKHNVSTQGSLNMKYPQEGIAYTWNFVEVSEMPA